MRILATQQDYAQSSSIVISQYSPVQNALMIMQTYIRRAYLGNAIASYDVPYSAACTLTNHRYTADIAACTVIREVLWD